MLTLADVIEALCGIRPERAGQVITEAVIDSRQAIPGSLFVALPGEQADGHDFVEEAFERGADLALVQRDLAADIPVLDLRAGWEPSALRGLKPHLVSGLKTAWKLCSR